MEEKISTQSSESPTKKPVNKLLLFVFLVAVALVIYSQTQKKAVDNKEGQVVSPDTNGQLMKKDEAALASYKDGVYDVKGNYVSPGGDEQIEVKLTLKDGLVSDAVVTPLAERPISQKFQGQFVSGYKEFVVGKKIDEIKLDKVSGSSLTPKGFNDAIEKIKAEAKV